MFSSVLNFFKKPQSEQNNTKDEKKNEDSIDEFIKTSTSAETLSKFAIKQEECAYFVGLKEMNDRKINIESENECNELASLREDKRIELFLDRLKNWK